MDILTGGDHDVPYYWTAEDSYIRYVVDDETDESDDPTTGDEVTSSLVTVSEGLGPSFPPNAGAPRVSATL